MRKIVKDAEPFERFILDRKEAREFCEGLSQELKVEHIDTGLAQHPTVSFYRQGEFVDLCRGPHIPDAGRIKAFKLLTVAGSYWKGDAANRQLQRLYGTAFFKKDELEAYLTQVEEAKRRDHRVLGKKLGLFSISNDVGQGLILWMPKGATVRALWKSSSRRSCWPAAISRSIRPTSAASRCTRPAATFPIIATRSSRRCSATTPGNWSTSGSAS